MAHDVMYSMMLQTMAPQQKSFAVSPIPPRNRIAAIAPAP